MAKKSVRIAAALGATVVALSIGACGEKDKAASSVPSAKPSLASASPDVWPLTGVKAKPERRPAVSVKVENSSEARPQSGLNEADIVYEQIVEGGISRYVAIYHSNYPESVGPVRSVRPVDGAIVSPIGGLLVFSGGQDRFVNRVRDGGLQTVVFDNNPNLFNRAPDRPSPHDVYGSVAQWAGTADNSHKDSPRSQFKYAKAPEKSSAQAGNAASAVRLDMSSVAQPSWGWDAASGKWLRFENHDTAVGADDVQLNTDNVVVLRVSVKNAGGEDAAGHAIPEAILDDSSGSGILASGGKTIEISWSKKGETDRIVLKDAGGKEIRLAPGKTWVELMPDTGAWELAPAEG